MTKKMWKQIGIFNGKNKKSKDEELNDQVRKTMDNGQRFGYRSYDEISKLREIKKQ